MIRKLSGVRAMVAIVLESVSRYRGGFRPSCALPKTSPRSSMRALLGRRVPDEMVRKRPRLRGTRLETVHEK